jgi:hypothetical protein
MLLVRIGARAIVQTMNTGDRKTFVVSVLIGRFAGTPWPFGRLYVSDEGVTVRSGFRERSCPRSEITDIFLERLGPQNQLLFEDVSGKLADVSIVIVMRVRGVVGELHRCGYPVTDRRARLFGGPER